MSGECTASFLSGTAATWDAQHKAVVVPSATLQQIMALICAALGGCACPTFRRDAVITTTQNTLADWAAGCAAASVRVIDFKSIADLICSR